MDEPPEQTSPANSSKSLRSPSLASENPESKRLRLSTPTDMGAGTKSETYESSSRMETVGPLGRSALPSMACLLPDWNIRRMHVVPRDLPIRQLKCQEAWKSLTESQRHFLHYFERAAWSGARICASQRSQESLDILRILLLVFSSTDFQSLRKESKKARVTLEEWEFFVAYSTCYLTNLAADAL